MSNRTLERVLQPDYLDGLDDLPIEGVRAKRTEVQRLEDAVSYLRRLVQARIDIVGSEVQARASGERADIAALVERLPTTLADQNSRTTAGRLVSTMAPPEDIETWASQRVDALSTKFTIGDVPEMSDDELVAMAEALGALERNVSSERRALHDRIDRLQAELIRRYKTGQATVEGLLS